ncbi:MAG: YbaB/EbfC family nucleoid-associated protein [Spirochaetaceae bacterium]|nr:YbaB/EbfC family nucleoid-associated protein [Spirochaetaceae bacterium]
MNINPFDILKNAQKIQEQMGSFQEQLGNITATGQAGGGMVEIDLNGKMEMLDVRISPDALGDAEMIQDLIQSAYMNGQEKIKDGIKKEMGSFIAGSGLENLGGAFPFA